MHEAAARAAKTGGAAVAGAADLLPDGQGWHDDDEHAAQVTAGWPANAPARSTTNRSEQLHHGVENH